MSGTAYHFNQHYGEEASLRDGTPVALRLVQAGDRSLLAGGFDRLSPRSRYLRFMGGKAALSDAELDALTRLDGENRFALAAVSADPEEAAVGLGVARFARLPEEPAVAEPAVTVVDAVQGRGLGSLLLRRLAAAARERGVERFRAEVLLRNEPVRRLLEDHTAATVIDTDEETLRVVIELPPFAALMDPSVKDTGLLGRLLAQAADGALSMRLGDALVKRR